MNVVFVRCVQLIQWYGTILGNPSSYCKLQTSILRHLEVDNGLGVMARHFNPSTWETEVGGSGQPDLHSETLSQKEVHSV